MASLDIELLEHDSLEDIEIMEHSSLASALEDHFIKRPGIKKENEDLFQSF